MFRPSRRFRVVVECFGMLMAAAGSMAPQARPSKLLEPADSSVATPMVRYESAFAGYQPFREAQIKPWKEANREAADNAGMGHDMGAMKAMPGMTMPGADKQTAGAPKAKEAARGHDMGAMKGTQGKEAMAMAHPGAKSGHSPPGAVAGISGTGVVQGIDKGNGKIKLTHDPVPALGWPKMTMFFRLKDRAMADPLNEGDEVEFSLEKSASGFVISALRKAHARADGR